MKVAEMNARQKKAFYNIYYAANWMIGGLENTLADNDPDSEEYKSAAAALADHEGLVAELYRAATTELYSEGSCSFSKDAEKALKDIRFCGKDFLMARCEARIKKMGY